MTSELGQFIQHRVTEPVALVIRLIEALKAGTLRTRRSPAPWLTRGFGWLRPLVPGHSLPNGWMDSLLADPEMARLLAASPRLARTTKPLCQMLGVQMPKFPAPVVRSTSRRRAMRAGPCPGRSRCSRRRRRRPRRPTMTSVLGRNDSSMVWIIDGLTGL